MTATGLGTWLRRRRAQKLSSRRQRHGLAAGLERAVEAAEEPPRFSSAAPVDRAAVLAARELLGELAHDLDTVEDAPPGAVLRVKRLLCDGGSPLYRSAGPDELKAELVRARAALLLR